MHPDSGQTTSLWMDSASVPSYPALTDNAESEVCIIGAGIAGLTTAYLLALEGQKVIVIDDGQIGSGETSRTTAHLSNEIDDRYVEIARVHGDEGARIAAASHTAAIDFIEQFVRTNDVECDFKRLDGFLFLAEGDTPDVLDEEHDAARLAGIVVEKVERAPIASFDTGQCLRFPNQARFHPLLYLAALAEAFVTAGGRIFCGTHVKNTEAKDGRATISIEKPEVKVTAEHLVVCTNSPIHDLFTMHTKQAPYRSYVVAAHVPRGAVTDALYWDTEDPYHYARLQLAEKSDEHDLLIVGGEDHKTGQETDMQSRFDHLERWTRERFPSVVDFPYHWSGQVLEPADMLAFIGRNPGDDNVYICTGDSGMGMTHGTMAGMIITDLIMKRDNPWAKLYDPSRISINYDALKTFVKENANVGVMYTDWLRPLNGESSDELARGEGKVIRRKTHPVAVYRDDGGALHEMTAVCPHLKCIVHWNTLEKSWDCPCHGSRFDAYGKVFTGPAVSSLEPVDAEGKPRSGA
ncbi:MAG TPA: FAD-dependent oxidoreductase [Gemmatimonadaceae bacterium]|nr:FAD-dependent oxidoreductase [Gemmatimonadaceae bacterium]